MRTLSKLLAATILSMGMITAPAWAQREISSFNADWRFTKGDIAGAEALTADDSGWTRVDVPHDWSIAGPFDQYAPAGGAGGFLPTGVAWYRKDFTLEQAQAGRRYFIEFDGVMAHSGVWVNGQHIGHRPNGYSSFRYELTDHLRYGAGEAGRNVIAVRADTERQPASRWYAGSGIYRHVRLITTGDIYVDTWGSRVTTPHLTAQGATVAVESSIMNRTKAERRARLEVELIGPDGKPAGTLQGAETVLPPGRAVPLTASLDLAQARRWDINDPALYTARIKVVADDGALLDNDEVRFGIREARFDAATGFWLNGRNIKLKGVALHADGGAFGMAVPLSFWERRLKGMQALGVNAIRTAHHPFSPEVLDLCDRLGIIVMNEAFDMWTVAKNPYDYHLYFTDWSALDAREFVRRDRNHPSVVIWSVGNEIHDTPYPIVAKSILERLMGVFHAEDPTRPVTMALFRPNTTGDYQNGLADMLDVVGQNYREKELAAAHADKPSRKIIGTENSKNRGSWLVVRDNPAYAGMFLWTGVDYLGEADRTGWPAISNPSGLVDRTDALKPLAKERAAWWSEKPVVHIARRVAEQFDNSEMPTPTAVALPAPKGPTALADWSPANREPHKEKVEIYTNAERVELFVNGRSQGVKPRNEDDSPVLFEVDFVPGTVKAVAFNGAAKVAEEELRTAGKPAALRLVAEQQSLAPGFDNIGFIRVEVVDKNGTLVPDAALPLTAEVTGAGVMAGFDNGAPSGDHTMFQEPTRKAREGRALLMVRASETKGSIKVKVTAPGVKSATATIKAVE
ncbi:glycoside hydrolase family 2 TIM barrel-domain containing protein [Niveispirillum irakense]|uniref:glycoside hydrolase family 2 TIM barrel-domain containing protein n=1 Tax=Niveispirillum irakense TaxID=34011 RepID=UPI0004096AE5|nr:glycoside hydrolase family 2 TIM barrel-domain containing protein [Niveispirillum irakense]